MKNLLNNYGMLEMVPSEAAFGAAELFRSQRKKGVTIRKSNNCLIAYDAIYFDIPIAHVDGDFEPISKHSHLKRKF